VKLPVTAAVGWQRHPEAQGVKNDHQAYFFELPDEAQHTNSQL
jgi:hypothetical protein